MYRLRLKLILMVFDVVTCIINYLTLSTILPQSIMSEEGEYIYDFQNLFKPAFLDLPTPRRVLWTRLIVATFVMYTVIANNKISV